MQIILFQVGNIRTTVYIPMQTKGEQQFDEAFFIRDNGAAVNHGENFLQRCPSYGAYLFRLELELFRMDIHGVNVYVTKALSQWMVKTGRAFPRSISRPSSSRVSRSAASRLFSPLTALPAALRSQRPAHFRLNGSSVRLKLAMAAENAYVDRQPVAVFLHTSASPSGHTGPLPIPVIQVETLHGNSSLQQNYI